MPISTRQQAAMRASLEAWMPSTATIQRPTTTQDATGAPVPGTPTTTTSKCRVRPKRSSTPTEPVPAIAARLTAQQQWAITFPAATDVRVTDQILVNGRTYEVLGVHGPKSTELSRQAVCVEIL